VLERKLIGMAPASRLGILRILIVFSALMYVVWEHFISFSEVPFAWYRPEGFMMFIPRGSMEALLTSKLALMAFKGGLLFFLTAALVGWKTRFSLFAATLLYFIFIGTVRAYAWFFHTGLLPFYLMFFLIWLPCGEDMSLDALSKPKTARDPRPSENIAWGVFLLRAVVAFSYFQAGFAKLRNTGLTWMEPWNLKRYVVEDSLTAMHFEFDFGLKMMHLPDTFWGLFAVVALFSELLYPCVLFSWRLRMIYPIAGVFLHSVILLMHNIFFPDLILLQMVFYDWDRILLPRALPPQDRRKAGLPFFRRT
jgi:hypothetical protein